MVCQEGYKSHPLPVVVHRRRRHCGSILVLYFYHHQTGRLLWSTLHSSSVHFALIPSFLPSFLPSCLPAIHRSSYLAILSVSPFRPVHCSLHSTRNFHTEDSSLELYRRTMSRRGYLRLPRVVCQRLLYSYSQLLLLKLGHNPEVVVVVGLMVMGFYSI